MKNLNLIGIIAVVFLFAIAASSPAPTFDSGTPVFMEDTGDGFIPLNAFFWSIQNNGPADGTIGGIPLDSGAVITSATFPCFMNDTVEYDADGNTYLIYYLTK